MALSSGCSARSDPVIDSLFWGQKKSSLSGAAKRVDGYPAASKRIPLRIEGLSGKNSGLLVSVLCENGGPTGVIATAAGANIAAVNYHYGSKADLYAEYVVEHLEAAMGRMPRLADKPSDPEGQLRQFVAWFFERYHPESPLRRMNRDMVAMKREFIDMILEKVIKPEFQNSRELVTALLPADAPEENIQRWVKCIISLCTGPIHGAHLYPTLFPRTSFDEAEIKSQSEHVAQFILDGLSAAASRLKAHCRRFCTINLFYR